MNGHYAKRFFGKVKLPIVGYNFNGNALDQYGALNQTLYGGATITGDKLNVAANGQYSQALDPVGIASFGSGAFTISGKIIFGINNLAFKFICNKRDTTTTFGDGAKAEYRFVIDLNYKLNIILFDSSQQVSSNLNAISVNALAPNTIYNIALTYGGGAGNYFKMYVNGSLIAHAYSTTGSYVQMRNTGSNLLLANYTDGLAPLIGSLDDFKLFNVELTADEVANL